jgi:hypothetical protein
MALVLWACAVFGCGEGRARDFNEIKRKLEKMFRFVSRAARLSQALARPALRTRMVYSSIRPRPLLFGFAAGMLTPFFLDEQPDAQSPPKTGFEQLYEEHAKKYPNGMKAQGLHRALCSLSLCFPVLLDYVRVQARCMQVHVCITSEQVLTAMQILRRSLVTWTLQALSICSSSFLLRCAARTRTHALTHSRTHAHRTIDQDGNGTIDGREWFAYLSVVLPNVGVDYGDRADFLFSMWDINNDGYMSFDELTHLCDLLIRTGALDVRKLRKPFLNPFTRMEHYMTPAELARSVIMQIINDEIKPGEKVIHHALKLDRDEFKRGMRSMHTLTHMRMRN